MSALPKASSACARRRRRLSPLAGDIMLAQGDGGALTPAAWIALAALAHLLMRPAELGVVLLPSAALFSALCLIALFDAAYFVIPDGPIWFLAAIGLATILSADPAETPYRLAAAAAGYSSLRLVAWGYEKWRGTAGVGQGDAKLYALAGLWLGFRGLPSCMVVAVLSALLAVVVAMRAGRIENAREPIPFGPHLTLGIWLVWAVGPLEIG